MRNNSFIVFRCRVCGAYLCGKCISGKIHGHDFGKCLDRYGVEKLTNPTKEKK